MVDLVKVKDCCEILDSKRIPITASKREKGIYPYYGANGIQDHINKYLFDDELVLVAEDGGNFNSQTKPIAYRVSGKCWVNNHAHVLKPKSFLDVDYLCYALAFYKVGNLVNGATRKKLTQKALKAMTIPIISLPEQKMIVNKIKLVKELIKIKEQELSKLDTLIKARFVEMFGDPGLVHRENKVCNLENVAEVRSSHRIFTREFTKSGVPFYRGTEISLLANGKEPIHSYYISKARYDEITKNDSKPKIGDLLMPSICDKGQIWLVNTSKPFYYKDGRVLCISPNREKFNTIFFHQYMKMKSQIEYLKIGSGSTFAEFKIFQLKKLKINIPPLKLQNEFASFVQQVDKSKVVIQKSLDETQTLFDSLMQKYFS